MAHKKAGSDGFQNIGKYEVAMNILKNKKMDKYARDQARKFLEFEGYIKPKSKSK